MRRSSLVLSVLALVVALGGTALAGGYIITSTKQIKPSVRRALKGNRGPRGYDGVDGPQGPQGLVGPTGPVGLAHIVITQGNASLCGGATSCAIGSATAICPAGTKPFGGGVLTDAYNGTFAGSISNNNGYTVGADNWDTYSSPASVTAFAYCSADVQSVQFPNGTVARSKIDALVAQRRAARR